MKINRANYNFRAVPLSPGEHKVLFRYEPLSFYAGAVITGATLLVLIASGYRTILRFMAAKYGQYAAALTDKRVRGKGELGEMEN